MAKFKTKNKKGIVVHSTSLPFFNYDNKKVHLNTLEFGKMEVPEHKFEDLTTVGGRFNQFYTYKISEK